MHKFIAISSITLALTACGGSNDTNPFLERQGGTSGDNSSITVEKDLGETDNSGDGTAGGSDGTSTNNTGSYDGNDENTNTSSGVTDNLGINSGLISPDGSKGDITGTLPDEDQSIFKASGDVKSVKFVKTVDQNANEIDALYIDNVPFDGVADLPYIPSQRFTTSQDGVGLFRSIMTVKDPISDEDIDQLRYYALYGKSETGATEFVIVKSDSYIGEGFGGHIFQRNQYDGAGNLITFAAPDGTQAKFMGKYDGFRVQTNGGFMTATRGDVEFVFDFDDFNDDPAVYFFATNRQMVGVDNAPIDLPDLRSVLQNSGIDETGSFSVEVYSEIEKDKKYENGKIEGLISGDVPTELVGVMTLSSTGTGGFYDPTLLNEFGTDNDTFIETSGIFAYR